MIFTLRLENHSRIPNCGLCWANTLRQGLKSNEVPPEVVKLATAALH